MTDAFSLAEDALRERLADVQARWDRDLAPLALLATKDTGACRALEDVARAWEWHRRADPLGTFEPPVHPREPFRHAFVEDVR